MAWASDFPIICDNDLWLMMPLLLSAVHLEQQCQIIGVTCIVLNTIMDACKLIPHLCIL